MFTLSNIARPIPNIVISSSIRAQYTQSAFQLKKKAAKDHANDGTGSHSHQANQYCIRPNCDKQVCPQLCDQPKELDFKGHNTHKPPVGRFARFISDNDANGNPTKRYFVKTNKSNKMTEQEKQNYGKEVKHDPKMENFIKNHSDKYD